jgi:spore maturation protein CgeB
MKVLCVFGKYQYGDPSRGIGTEYAAFVPALERLGHQVVHFESWHRTERSLTELNRALLRCVERENPDVMLTVQTQYELWRETLLAIKRRGSLAAITWMTDDSWKYDQVSRHIADAYHAVATTYDWVVPRYHRDGVRHVLATQWAASAATLQPPRPAGECQYEVTFVGANHGTRARLVDALRKRRVEVRCFGHGWPGGSIPAERIPQIFNDSVISLNFANSRGENQIKARTFEVPGAGGFLLTEDACGIEKYYSTDREIVLFRNVDEAVQKIRYYLAHHDERDRIANAGFERTAREHTYDKRMEELLAFAVAARDSSAAAANADWRDVARADGDPTAMQRVIRSSLIGAFRLIWGDDRGWRAARRLVFEASWRLAGKRTFTAASWPGRMFPESIPPSRSRET